MTIITNTCQSHRDSVEPTKTAATAKNSKHKTNVESAGAYQFFPMVLESSGNCDSLFDDFINHCARYLPMGDKKDFRRRFCFATSVALQRGNARIIKHAYARIRSTGTFGTHAWM